MHEIQSKLKIIMGFTVVSMCFGTSDVADLIQANFGFPLIQLAVIYGIAGLVLFLTSMIGKSNKTNISLRAILTTGLTIIALPSIIIISAKSTVAAQAIPFFLTLVPVFVVIIHCIRNRFISTSASPYIGFSMGTYGTWLSQPLNTYQAVDQINISQFCLLTISAASVALGAVETHMLL